MQRHLPLQDPPKFTQIWIFGLKTNHLATLVGMCVAKDRLWQIWPPFVISTDDNIFFLIILVSLKDKGSVLSIEILVLERVPMFVQALQTFWAKKTL
jgi:hypothetical protein